MATSKAFRPKVCRGNWKLHWWYLELSTADIHIFNEASKLDKSVYKEKSWTKFHIERWRPDN